jgi:diguanylate cyclase (GGDEF)-like protein
MDRRIIIRFIGFILLLSLAWIGETFGLPIMFGIDFTFGYIFLFMIAIIYGPIRGIIASMLLVSILIWTGDASWLMLITVLELAVVSFLFQRKSHIHFVAWDIIFWFVLLIPLSLYFIVIDAEGLKSVDLLYWLKQMLNSWFNAFAAEMIIIYLPLSLLFPERRALFGLSFRKIILHLMIFAIIGPYLVYIMINHSHVNESIQDQARQSLSAKANTIDKQVANWDRSNLEGLELNGRLQAAYIQQYLYNNEGIYYFTVVNDYGEVLASYPENQKFRTAFISFDGMRISDLSSDLYQGLIAERKQFPPWQEGFFIYKKPLVNLPIDLFVYIPMNYYLESLVDQMNRQYFIMILFVLLAMLLSMLVNKLLVNALTRLADVTTDLPYKLKNDQLKIEWPSSEIIEISILVRNYKDMSENLKHMFSEAHEVNQKLVEQADKLKQSEEKLHHLAYYDVLTGLPNRLHFQMVLDKTIEQAIFHDKQVGVIFMDLNQFKQINDTLGHAVGDELLKQVAVQLLNLVNDRIGVYRLGGDEFVILLEDTYSEEIELTADRVMKQFEKPVTLQEHHFYVTASLGSSLYPKDGSDSDTIVKNADMAMYAAKELDGNRYSAYKTELNHEVSERVALQNGLRIALEENQFELVYQPKVNGSSNEWTGVEALIRWNHPNLGMVSPVKFIPLAEETGLILDIDYWVLRESCRQIKQWQTEGLHPLPVAVNMSAKHFYKKETCGIILDILEQNGLTPEYLHIEITEGVLMMHTEQVLSVIDELNREGIHISIDDFGTGYSSLNQLQHLPIYAIKIDRSFVTNVAKDFNKAAIVKAIIELAHSMDLKVVAEGVETEEERAYLQAQHCDELQGYMFSRPIPPAVFAEKLQALMTGTVKDYGGGRIR